MTNSPDTHTNLGLFTAQFTTAPQHHDGNQWIVEHACLNHHTNTTNTLQLVQNFDTQEYRALLSEHDQALFDAHFSDFTKQAQTTIRTALERIYPDQPIELNTPTPKTEDQTSPATHRHGASYVIRRDVMHATPADIQAQFKTRMNALLHACEAPLQRISQDFYNTLDPHLLAQTTYNHAHHPTLSAPLSYTMLASTNIIQNDEIDIKFSMVKKFSEAGNKANKTMQQHATEERTAANEYQTSENRAATTKSLLSRTRRNARTIYAASAVAGLVAGVAGTEKLLENQTPDTATPQTKPRDVTPGKSSAPENPERFMSYETYVRQSAGKAHGRQK